MGKKIFDFLGALVLLVLTAPLFSLIAIWIKATSPGPIIFRQTRLGYRGVSFMVFKFRTLRDKTGRPMDMVLWGDQRVTAPGRFLRKTHMDELPQLINVLLGQMSLVGPRPRPLGEVEKYTREVPGYKYRLNARPGLTGLEQLHGRAWSIKYGPRSALRLDLFYIDHQNIRFDLEILFKTIGVVLRRQGI